MIRREYGLYGPYGQYWSICTPQKSPFNLTICQNDIFFQENIDLNIELVYIYMIIDHQIDEKYHFLS